MKIMLKNVLVVDGSGWFPFWGDIVMEDGKVTNIYHGENTALHTEASMDKIYDYKAGDYTLATGLTAYAVPGIEPPMTMEKYQAQLEQIMEGIHKGTPIEKTVRAMTGFGYDKIEFLLPGSPANIMIVDKKPTTQILKAFADGEEIA